MKLLSGAVLLVGAEQSFAHAHLIQFPNQDVAASILVPASLVLLVLGSLLMIWGLVTDGRIEDHRKGGRQSTGDSGQ